MTELPGLVVGIDTNSMSEAESEPFCGGKEWLVIYPPDVPTFDAVTHELAEGPFWACEHMLELD